MPSEYYLNGQALSAFGFVPGHATGSNLAISGAWDLPRRFGDSCHTWQEANGIEPYVDEEDIKFSPREIRLVGSIFDENRTLFLERLKAFRTFIQTLPAEFELRCQWGRWRVNRRSKATVELKAACAARITLVFHEPAPDLSGSAPPQWLLATRFWNLRGVWIDDALWYDRMRAGAWLLETGLWNTAGVWDQGGAWYGNLRANVDDWLWSSFGIILSGVTDAATIPAVREINITQPAVREMLYVPGGRESRSLTLSGWLVAADMVDFERKVRSLYWLFGSAGLRRFHYQGQTYDCFATEGFTLTEIQKREKVYAKFKIKLLESGNE